MHHDSDHDVARSSILPAAFVLGAGGASDLAASIRDKIPSTFGVGEILSGEPGLPIAQTRQFRKKDLDIISRFAKKHSVTAPVLKRIINARGTSSYYYDPKILFNNGSLPEHVGLGRASVPVALHELGHGSPVLKSVHLRRGLHSLIGMTGFGSPLGTLIRQAVIVGALMGPGEKDGIRKKISDYAPAVVAATVAPQIAEEARASLKALGGASKSGLKMRQIARVLAPGFGTYLAAGALPIATAMLARYIGRAANPSPARKNKKPASRGELKKVGAKLKNVAIKSPKVLRASAESAWRMGGSKPKPKTIPPNSRVGMIARQRAAAKPPSKRAFYRDMIESMHNPSRGFRATVMS